MFMQDATRFVAAGSIQPTTRAKSDVASGLVAGTLVETSTGWRASESLCRGDLVQSFDGGLREVIAVDHSWLMPGTGVDLVYLPGGLLGNAKDLFLHPGQHLLIDSWDASDLTDAVSALVSASTLAAAFALRRITVQTPVEVATPLFAEEEVIWANSGLILHCPGAATGVQTAPTDSFYPMLPNDVAIAILKRNTASLAA
jgi:hypothetical protein